MSRRVVRWSLLGAIAIVSLECRRQQTMSDARGATATSPSSAPSAKMTTSSPSTSTSDSQFHDAAHGIAFDLPAGWKSVPSNDYVLALVPTSHDTFGTTSPPISLDIPDLPAHIPGLIPVGSVKNGYVDDLQKQFAGLSTQDLKPTTNIPDAQVRFVRSTWNKGSSQETALLIVHGDRVYILRATSDAAHEGDARKAFDAIVNSIRWIPSHK